MNLDTLHRKLMAAAQSQRPSDAVPYAFEKRIMARLAVRSTGDAWGLWGRALWQGAAACVAASVLVSGLCLVSFDDSTAVATADQDFESTVFASADQLSDAW